MSTNDLSTVLGALAPLYSDPTITDIMVDAPDRVYIVRSGTAGALEQAEVVFDSPEAIRHVIDVVMALGGVTLGPANTIGEIRLPDGSRAAAVIPPVAVDNPYLVIRKTDPEKFSFTWEKLLDIGTLSAEAHSVLMQAINYRVNVLIVGNAKNSGKDYIVNLMAQSLPPEERVIVIADAFELPVGRHPRRIHLEPGPPAKMSVGSLLDVATKMRPDWLVVGDLRGAEAMSAIQLMYGGHHLLTSLYADSPADALTRLEALCLMASPGLSLAEIRQMIAGAIGLISFQKNHTLPDYRIKITQLVEVQGVENGRYVLQPLFTYNNEQGVLHPTDAGKSWAERVKRRLTRG